jgi:hypothetical protein
MKTINVPEDAVEINALLDQARCDDLVLRTADGTQFLLVEDFEDEVRRTRNNEELMALLDERRREAATISLEEIKQELGLQ